MSAKLRERQPEPEIECPDFDADEDDDPLFNSTREYVEQVDRYKEHQGRPIARRARAVRTVRPPAPAAPARSGKFTRG